MNRGIAACTIIISIILAGCSSTQPPTSKTQPQQNEPGIIGKVAGTFETDNSKLKREFTALNDENMTFFTEVDVQEDGQDIIMKFVVTPNATSRWILNLFTLAVSIKTYNVTQDFDDLKIDYLDSNEKVIGTMTIPNKAIKDIADYNDDHEVDMMENPYVEPFWKVTQRMYDESVPEMFPTSIGEDFGIIDTGDEEIAEALEKNVTHLEIECNYPENWDADADDDGITYSLRPLADDNSIVPIEGTVEAQAYERIQIDELGMEFEKGKLLYTGTNTLEGKERLKYFTTWDGYSIRLDWDNVQPYPASSDDYGILYVTFTDNEGKSFEARTGEDFIYECQLRE